MVDIENKLKKRWIRPLPKQVINKIAAGEVVDRPASVVKELVENSIDSGADRIEIIIEKSGGKVIKIIDNGCGIAEDQMEIAFSRHATSKISNFKDLDTLDSYGFRGEALPSIASVSRMRMISRPHDASSGFELIYEGGVLQSFNPVPAQPGTTIEIENLFYNTPARRKFLKSEATESRHISRTATAMAIGRFDLGFSYKLNGRNMFSLPAKGTLGERVTSILAPNQKFVPVEFENQLIKINGFIGLPEMAQRNRNGFYLFINNRFIQSPTISHGVSSGYGELLPGGRFPIGALLVTVNPEEVDVNVHPTKIEVRLSREREIHDLVHKAVKESLRRDGIIPVFKTSSPSPSGFSGNQNYPSNSDSRNRSQATIPGIYSKPVYDKSFMNDLYKTPVNPISEPGVEGENHSSSIVNVDTKTGEIIETVTVSEGPSTGFKLIGRFSDLYLLLQAGEDLYIVDQHTAHERVLYEEILKRIDQQSINSQQLLFPEQFELSPEQLGVFEESEELLKNSGFIVEGFGGRTIKVEALPAILAKKSAEKLMLKVLDDIASLTKTGLDLKKAMAQSIACRAAVMSGDKMSDQEAVHLMHQLLQCDNKYSCPHGRPTFIRLTRTDLDKQFGRI